MINIIEEQEPIEQDKAQELIKTPIEEAKAVFERKTTSKWLESLY